MGDVVWVDTKRWHTAQEEPVNVPMRDSRNPCVHGHGFALWTVLWFIGGGVCLFTHQHWIAIAIAWIFSAGGIASFVWMLYELSVYNRDHGEYRAYLADGLRDNEPPVPPRTAA
jgi:hypothetical protein